MDEHLLPPAPPSPSTAREIVRSVSPPLSADASDAVLLMTSEIVTNALRHGRPQSAQEIVLRVERGPHNVRIEVVNDGPVFVPEPPFQPNADRDGGYGLYIVNRLASAWGVEPEGDRTRVWFEVDDDADA
jgi:anti-sigma regulatory factor (Ser/Thr protein kinase)